MKRNLNVLLSKIIHSNAFCVGGWGGGRCWFFWKVLCSFFYFYPFVVPKYTWQTGDFSWCFLATV